MAKKKPPLPDRHTLYQRSVQAPEAEIDFPERDGGPRGVIARERSQVLEVRWR